MINFLTIYLFEKYWLVVLISALFITQFNPLLNISLFLDNHINILVLTLTIIILYSLSFNKLKNSFYVEKTLSKIKLIEKKEFFQGEFYEFTIIIKAIIRNRRSKEYFLFSGLSLIFFVVIYYEKFNNYLLINVEDSIQILFSTFYLSLTFFQLCFNWDSENFLFFMSNMKIKSYLKCKKKFSQLLILFSTFFFLPLIFFNWEFIILIASITLFNLGILNNIIFCLSILNIGQKIDLNISTVLNYSGIDKRFVLLVTVVSILTLLLFKILFSIDANFYFKCTLIGLIGLLGLLYSKKWASLHFKYFKGKYYNRIKIFQ